MLRNSRFVRWHIKYCVKSPVLFYAFLILFIAVFLITSLSLKLDIRRTFPATINNNVLLVVTEAEIIPLDEKVYFYKNRNEKIHTASITRAEYEDSLMLFYISGDFFSQEGELTLEITIDKQSLLKKIFAKAGKSG